MNEHISVITGGTKNVVESCKKNKERTRFDLKRVLFCYFQLQVASGDQSACASSFTLSM